MIHTRRDFLKTSTALSAGALLPTSLAFGEDKSSSKPLFDISLAGWSLHRAIFAKKLDHLDFPVVAKKDYGISAVEYVNQFFMDKAKDNKYLTELKKRAADNGVKSLLIMCDREGRLGDPSKQKRMQAVENHKKWLEAAKFLGCHSIRVNAGSAGSYDEQKKLAADGLRKLTELAAPMKLNVIVENHGGLSSNGAWLAAVMKQVNHKRCGTLPDFGNFRLSRGKNYDRYKGVKELMPFAKGVSAKSHDFDANGNETATDYYRMIKIVLDAGYKGYIGIEYEGRKKSEAEGIKLTKALLEKVRAKLAGEK